MRFVLRVGLLSIAACAPAARPAAAPPPVASAPPEPVMAPLPPLPVSARAKVTLRVDHADRLLLGENVLVHYCIENTSAAEVTINMGGDYRGASRSTRFKVTVTDARGVAVDDPDPHPFSMGGLSMDTQLKPHASWCQSLPLHRYARVDLAGRYTVRVLHDLSWPEGTAPGGEAHVTFAMPTATEAEGVITKMEALKPREPGTAGELSAPYPDFSSLRYPVYLEPLARRAAGGNLEAIGGIGEIPNVEATRALLGLLEHAKPEVAEAAAGQLSMRLPDPALSGALGPRNPFFNELNEQRKYLGKASWRPELTSDVRAAAAKLLAKDDDRSARTGAFFLEAVGAPADNGVLVDAFTRAIARTITTPREKGIFPTPRGACQELGRAAEILLARGVVPMDPPRSTGEIAEWLITIKKGARPAGWGATLGHALGHANMYVRRLALEAMPDPIPPGRMKDIEAALASSDVDVQLTAIAVVERSALATLGGKTAAVIATASDRYLMSTAWNAASSVGARAPAVDALIGRLTDPALADEVLGMLLDVFEQNGRSHAESIAPEEAKALAARWRVFVAKNRARIEKKDRLSLDDAPRDLVPKGWRIGRNGKPDWP